MISLDKFRQLPSHERWLFLQAVCLLPLIHLGLLLLGYLRLMEGLEKIVSVKAGTNPRSETEIIAQAQRSAWIISQAARHGIYKASCLRKSILLWFFLRRQRVETCICFGVRIVHRQLEAHAWVEYRGIVLNDLADIGMHYRALVNELPPTKRGL